MKTEKLVLGAIDSNNESYKLVEMFDAERTHCGWVFCDYYLKTECKISFFVVIIDVTYTGDASDMDTAFWNHQLTKSMNWCSPSASEVETDCCCGTWYTQ